MNRALVAYLNGAHERLRAAFRASEEMSNTTKGAVREFGLRSALEYCLPPIARLYSGDVIDANDGRSGQLDFIVGHAGCPALGSREDEPRLVLAEGVLGVIEMKSNLAKQWDQVKSTWDQLKRLRRSLPRMGLDPTGRPYFTQANAHPSEHAIPFYVLGECGWTSPGELGQRAEDLRRAFDDVWAPAVVVAQLDPPAVGIAFPGDAGQDGHNVPDSTVSFGFAMEDRGLVLANLWVPLTQRAQSFGFTPIDWARYTGATHVTATEAASVLAPDTLVTAVDERPGDARAPHAASPPGRPR